VLKLRVASALVLAVVVIAAVVNLPTPWLAAFFHVLVLVAVREWAKLAGVETRVAFVVYATLVSAVVAGLWLAPDGWRQGYLLLAGGFWIAALVVVWTYPASAGLFGSKSAMMVLGGLVLPGAWLALVTLATLGPRGPLLLIWFLAAVAAADIAAYFAGRRLGRTQLASRVSPGKTWEGAFGGGLAALAWGACGAGYFAGNFAAELPSWIAAVAALTVAGVAGDLFESAFKRSRGVKDSGAILPGHGGILDRIDAVVAAAPVFALLAPALVLPG